MTDKKTIKWGIIGCGDVAEVKSGPAFQKCDNSELIAVMRRNADLAKDLPKDIMCHFGMTMLKNFYQTKTLMPCI